MVSVLQINTNVFDNPYYRLGYLSPRLFDKNTATLCYPDFPSGLKCRTKNFSMCRFPNTKWNARVYYDSPRSRFRNCNCNVFGCKNQCDKYLFKV